MKVSFLALSLFLILACNKTQTREVENLAIKDIEESVSPKISSLLVQIIGKDGGIIRGFDFNDKISKVQDQESIEQFESESDHIGFTFDTAEMQTVDVLYYFNQDDFLTQVQVDIYMNTEDESKELFTALRQYLTARYGEPKVQIGQPTWVTDEAIVSIKTIKTKLDTGLVLNFQKP